MPLYRIGSSLMRSGGGVVRSESAYSGLLVPSPAGDYDYVRLDTIPDGFGDGEFCLVIDCTPLASGTTINADTIDTGDTTSVQEWRWSSNNNAIYSSTEWWWRGNFLLDGHNNNNWYDGTFSVQLTNSGRVQWTFGDGAAANARTGDLHGLRGTTDIRGSRTRIYLVRRWDGGSGAELELWVNGSLEDSETSTARTNMATTYWDSWSGFPSSPDQGNWMLGTEKQAALGVLGSYEDFMGRIHRVRFYNSAPASGELSGQNIAATPVADYDFSEGTGSTIADSNGGPSMTVVNPDPAFWSAN